MFGGTRHGVLSDPQKTNMPKKETRNAGLSKFVLCHAYKILIFSPCYAAQVANCSDMCCSKACNHKRISNYESTSAYIVVYFAMKFSISQYLG